MSNEVLSGGSLLIQSLKFSSRLKGHSESWFANLAHAKLYRKRKADIIEGTDAAEVLSSDSTTGRFL